TTAGNGVVTGYSSGVTRTSVVKMYGFWKGLGIVNSMKNPVHASTGVATWPTYSPSAAGLSVRLCHTGGALLFNSSSSRKSRSSEVENHSFASATGTHKWTRMRFSASTVHDSSRATPPGSRIDWYHCIKPVMTEV